MSEDPLRTSSARVASGPSRRLARPGGEEREQLVLEDFSDPAAEGLRLVGGVGGLRNDPVDDADLLEVDGEDPLRLGHLGGVVDRIVAESPDAADEPETFCRRVGEVLEDELLALLASGPGEPTARAARYAG